MTGARRRGAGEEEEEEERVVQSGGTEHATRTRPECRFLSAAVSRFYQIKKCIETLPT